MRLSISLMIACVALFAMGYVERAIVAARQSFGTGREDEPPLPEGVVAVEWLESDGNQYVVIGETFGADYLSIEAEAEIIPQSGSRRLMGNGYWANNQDNFSINSVGWGGLSSFLCIIGQWVLIEFDRNNHENLFVDGKFYGRSIKFFSNVDVNRVLVLFCCSNGSGPYRTSSGEFMPWIGRIGRVRISGSGEMIRDLIPVRVGEGEEAEGSFYDLVSGEFFGNGGTGKLGVGGDL